MRHSRPGRCCPHDPAAITSRERCPCRRERRAAQTARRSTCSSPEPCICSPDPCISASVQARDAMRLSRRPVPSSQRLGAYSSSEANGRTANVHRASTSPADSAARPRARSPATTCRIDPAQLSGPLHTKRNLRSINPELFIRKSLEITTKADARTRTGDPFITSEVLYQLSYVGACRAFRDSPPSGTAGGCCKSRWVAAQGKSSRGLRRSLRVAGLSKVDQALVDG
jgi:hypothetical protein